MDALHLSLAQIRAKAAELRESFGDEARARALEWAVRCMETALGGWKDDLLTLTEAARESGYSADHLGREIRAGRIPNAGRPHAPRIRRGELPRKPGPLRSAPALGVSRVQIARSVVNRSQGSDHD